VTIENCRINGANPELPKQHDEIYFGSLSKFERYLLDNLKNISDRIGFRLALSLLATVNGQPRLGKAIENLDEDVLDEFLSQ
jgi:Holliday junction resolvasome RuvABC DNA-binding subunit